MTKLSELALSKKILFKIKFNQFVYFLNMEEKAVNFINDQYVSSSSKADDSLPRITLTFAQSIDAKISNKDKQPILLSSKESMFMTQYLRCQNEGIMVGIGTVLSDNPRLTVRETNLLNQGYKQPRPIVIDRDLQIPLNCNLMKNEIKPIIVFGGELTENKLKKIRELENLNIQLISTNLIDGKVDLKEVFEQLKLYNINSIMVEGGSKIIFNLLSNFNLIHHLIVTICPIIVGSNGTSYILENQQGLNNIKLNNGNSYCQLGPDIISSYIHGK
ncbi:hypothetical protein K502DRAFT_322491 [Neoconidiobolus thromboides FSU 785]|nr:hypothetical protein K502DRAFT_322491 [Neoconidiobolus thromboides FSU 785]